MTFPDRDAYMFKLDHCTFYIEREGPCLWLLSYRNADGHYHFRRCSTARDCAALLDEHHEDDEDWIKLKERIPSLVLSDYASDLSFWVGVSHVMPR